MHTVFALLCFVVVIHWLIFPYPSGLLHWHCGNLTIAPVPAKQPWWIWISTSCELIMNDCITTTKQSTTKPCAYLLGYTVEDMGYLTIIKRFGPPVEKRIVYVAIERHHIFILSGLSYSLDVVALDVVSTWSNASVCMPDLCNMYIMRGIMRTTRLNCVLGRLFCVETHFIDTEQED